MMFWVEIRQPAVYTTACLHELIVLNIIRWNAKKSTHHLTVRECDGKIFRNDNRISFTACKEAVALIALVQGAADCMANKCRDAEPL